MSASVTGLYIYNNCERASLNPHGPVSSVVDPIVNREKTETHLNYRKVMFNIKTTGILKKTHIPVSMGTRLMHTALMCKNNQVVILHSGYGYFNDSEAA